MQIIMLDLSKTKSVDQTYLHLHTLEWNSAQDIG